MHSESGINMNRVLKTNKIQENINYNINNINNGNNNSLTNNNFNMKLNQQDQNFTQNKIIGQNFKTNGFNNMKSLDSSKGTISTKNFNGKKFIFNEKNELESNITNEENSNNNLNRFTKIGKDSKPSTKQIDRVKNIFSSKIADN
jgi:hypothetical protein